MQGGASDLIIAAAFVAVIVGALAGLHDLARQAAGRRRARSRVSAGQRGREDRAGASGAVPDLFKHRSVRKLPTAARSKVRMPLSATPHFAVAKLSLLRPSCCWILCRVPSPSWRSSPRASSDRARRSWPARRLIFRRRRILASSASRHGPAHVPPWEAGSGRRIHSMAGGGKGDRNGV
jgi:hypothetical protein